MILPLKPKPQSSQRPCSALSFKPRRIPFAHSLSQQAPQQQAPPGPNRAKRLPAQLASRSAEAPKVDPEEEKAYKAFYDAKYAAAS